MAQSVLTYNQLEDLRRTKAERIRQLENAQRQRGYSKDSEDRQIDVLSGELGAIQELQAKIGRGEQFTESSGISYIESSGTSSLERADTQKKTEEYKTQYAQELEEVNRSQTYEQYAKAYSKLPNELKTGYNPPGSQEVKSYFSGGQLTVSNIKTPAQELPTTKSDDTTKLTYTNKKSKGLTFGYERPQIKEAGTFLVTEEEGKKLEKTPFSSYWTIKSTNLQGAITEGQFAGTTPQRTGVAFGTTGQYQFNRQQIIAQQETFKQYQNIITDFQKTPEKYKGQEGVITETIGGNEQISLTPSFFESKINSLEIYKNALISSKEQYSQLSKYDRSGLYGRGLGVGTAQLGLGLAEFTGTVFLNLGSQQIKPGDKLKTRQLYIGGGLGNIRTFPTTQPTVKFTESPISYIKQKGTSPEFIGGAIIALPLGVAGAKGVYSNIRQFGIKGGLAETASSISPLRIQNGIYTPSVDSSTKLNIKSIKYTDPTGRVTRTYTGQSDLGDIKIGGLEQSKTINGKTIGGGFKVTTTPYYEIRAGGGIVKSGVRQSIQPYSFETRGTGSSYKVSTNGLIYLQGAKIPSSLANVRTAKGVDFFTETGAGGGTIKGYSYGSAGYQLTTGGSSKEIRKGVSSFFSGRAKPIYETQLIEGGFISKPSGRFRLNPNVKGIEYDLNKGIAGQQGNTYSNGNTGSKSIIKTIQRTQGAIGVNIPTTTQVQKGSSKIIFTQPTKQTTQEQIKVFTPSVSKQITEVNVRAEQRPIQINQPIGAITTLQKTGQKNKQSPMAISTVGLGLGLIANTAQSSATSTIQRVKIVQRQTGKSITTSSYDFPTITDGAFRPLNPTTPIPIIPLGLGGFDSLSLGIGNVKAKPSGRSYVPSYSALFFNIKGKQPKGNGKTGLGFRPITSGFNIGNFLGFGNKRVIKIRRVL